MKNWLCGLLGWRNDSKWKRLIKSVQSRVKILNNKRESIIRRSKEDVVQLLNNGEDQRAIIRVDMLSKDQNIVAAYALLGDFCELVLIHLPYIRRCRRDCPNDINQAASSLLYASARCGDLPELLELRTLFRKSYGEFFVKCAIELLPGNLVNQQVIEKLSMKSISHEVKFKLMKEIAIDNGLEFGPPEIDCKLELQQDKVCDLSCALDEFDSEKKATDVVESLNSNQINSAKVEQPKEMDHHLYEPEIILHRFSSHSPPGVSSSSSSRASIQHTTESHVSKHASENSFQLSERNTVYHDDLEEFTSRKSGERYNEDGLHQGSSECSFNCDVEDNCSLEGPCYSVTSEDIDDSDCPTPKSSVYQSHKPEIRRKEVESCTCSSGSDTRKMSPLMSQTRAHLPYLRTSMTMPLPERPKDVVLLKSASCDFPQQSNHSNGSSSSPWRHIHPKLPDCDEFKATFMALKEEYIHSVIQDFCKEYMYSNN